VVAARKRWAKLPCLGVGHFVPTAAVLTTPAQKKAKAFFCSKAPALLRSSGDAPKAGHLRPTLALETFSLGVGKKKNTSCEVTSLLLPYPTRSTALLRPLAASSLSVSAVAQALAGS
jgi:hypothetical protein